MERKDKVTLWFSGTALVIAVFWPIGTAWITYHYFLSSTREAEIRARSPGRLCGCIGPDEVPGRRKDSAGSGHRMGWFRGKSPGANCLATRRWRDPLKLRKR